MAYSSINKPSLHFNTVLYTGDATSNRGITGVGFQPDLVWNKSRSNAYNHYVFDAVRGAGQRIGSNTNSAQDDKSAEFISFDSDGFTLTNNAGSLNINGSGVTFANWCWKADNTSGSSNTDGSITSTVAANTTAGFSIVQYTGNGTAGATVGHGLSAAPTLILEKIVSSANNWLVYSKALGATQGLALDETTAAQTSTTYWNDTAPTSSVFSIGDNGKVNLNTATHIAYCFTDIKGYSKFGSYTGNASTDGPFVYCGFKPALIILRTSNIVKYWNMQDTVRETYNPADRTLYPNVGDAESDGVSQWSIDFLSNGFKIRSSTTEQNGSGNTIIYMAFAEETLVGTNNVCATAR